MKSLLALLVSTAFVLLGAWHFYMAFGGKPGDNAAVPSVNGKPLFVPSRRSTIAVGFVLMLFALLVAATAGYVSVGLPRQWLVWLSYALALGLLARAIGEFRYVGFFKKVRGSRFARMDSLLYSPLCLLLSGSVATVAVQQ